MKIGESCPNDDKITEGSLEVKLPTIWTDGKAEVERVREEKESVERRSYKRKSQEKEDAGARKGIKVANRCVFLMICGSGGSKSRLAKAAGAEPSRQMGDEKIARHCGAKRVGGEKAKSTSCPEHFWQLRPLWCEAHFEVKLYKAPQCRTAFGS